MDPTVSPGMMSPSATPSLRPLSLLSRPLPGSQGPAASSLALLPSCLFLLGLPDSPSLCSLPKCVSFRPASLNLLPLRYLSFLPGTARLSVAPSQGGFHTAQGVHGPGRSPRALGAHLMWVLEPPLSVLCRQVVNHWLLKRKGEPSFIGIILPPGPI